MRWYYTDGSTHPTNPGPGGFGVVILDENLNVIDTYSKQTSEITTNNREEMKAILYAICDAVLHGETYIHICSDSAYAINSFSVWREGWKKKGWIKSDGKTPENLDLIKTYDELASKYDITFHKVKGHVGQVYNEMADKLAKGEKICH